jgi:hypothetical protein
VLERPDRLAVYDATGREGCAGTPVVCAPLWTATGNPGFGGLLAVAEGRVQASTWGGFATFDAAGADGCAGTPVTCRPLSTATLPDGLVVRALAVAERRVVTVSSPPSSETVAHLHTWDAAGTEGCTGTPVACTPRSTAQLGTQFAAPAVGRGLIVVQHQQVFATTVSTTAYPLRPDGTCLSPGLDPALAPVCPPVWTAAAGAGGLSGLQPSPPTIANDVVLTSEAAEGTRLVRARSLATGAPAWSLPVSAPSVPVVSGGRVYAARGGETWDDVRVEVFGLPPAPAG